MEKEQKFIDKPKTLDASQRELLDKINDGMKEVKPEDYDEFILQRRRDNKAKVFSRELNEILDSDKQYRALELGPGTGIFTKELYELPNVNITSIDKRNDMVDYGIEKDRIQKNKVVIGDFEKMPFQDDSFDLLTGMAILNQRNDIDFFFSEIKRVLKNGGLIFFPWIKTKGKFFQREVDLLREYGFEIVNIEENYILAKNIK